MIVINLSKINLELLKSDKNQVNIFILFKKKEIFFEIFFIGFACSSFYILLPGYTINMFKVFKLNNDYSSYFFSIFPLFVCIGNLILMLIKIKIKILIQISFVFGFFSLIFIGPCQFLNIPNNLIIVGLGITFSGLNYCFSTSQGSIYLGQYIFKANYANMDSNECYLLGSFLNQFIHAIFAVFFKLFGGFITYEIGFQNGMGYSALFFLLYLIFLFFLGKMNKNISFFKLKLKE